ncbi:hypothetical protein U1Q18_031133 [Sarracenia purpurea var. burkii]
MVSKPKYVYRFAWYYESMIDHVGFCCSLWFLLLRVISWPFVLLCPALPCHLCSALVVLLLLWFKDMAGFALRCAFSLISTKVLSILGVVFPWGVEVMVCPFYARGHMFSLLAVLGPVMTPHRCLFCCFFLLPWFFMSISSSIEMLLVALSGTVLDSLCFGVELGAGTFVAADLVMLLLLSSSSVKTYVVAASPSHV